MKIFPPSYIASSDYGPAPLYPIQCRASFCSGGSTPHLAGTHLCVGFVAEAPSEGGVFLVFLGDVAIGRHVARVVNGVMA